MKKILVLVLAVILLLALVTTCARSREIHTQTFFLMDTVVELQAQASRNNAEQAMHAACAELKRIEHAFGYEASLITELNTIHTIRDAEAHALVRTALAIGTASRGGFDITLKPMLEAWGFTPHMHRHVPDRQAFEHWQRMQGKPGVHLGHDGRTVTTDTAVQVDLGGITKGYAADRAALTMRTQGVRTGLVNAGGDIATFGSRTWRIGIKHPRGSSIIATIPIRGRAIATSGDYERFFFEGNNRYCHILDPATGWPADHHASATVIAPRCVDADAWATALFVKGPAPLQAVLARKGYDWIAIDNTGAVSASPAMKAYCPRRISMSAP